LFFALPASSPPLSTLFPYTTLFRSARGRTTTPGNTLALGLHPRPVPPREAWHCISLWECHSNTSHGSTQFQLPRPAVCGPSRRRDRKSTRLNSSHVSISYAVFCLKK